MAPGVSLEGVVATREYVRSVAKFLLFAEWTFGGVDFFHKVEEVG